MYMLMHIVHPIYVIVYIYSNTNWGGVRPGSQYDTGAMSIMNITSIPGKIYIPGRIVFMTS